MKTIVPSPSRTTHAARSHPETEERLIALDGGIEDEAPATRRTAFRPTNPELRAELDAWIERNGYTREEAGKALGFKDSTAVSKYIGDKFDRDPEKFEKALREVLAHEKRARHFGGKIIRTNVVEKLAVFVDRIRQTSTCGVFSGEAGIGKTVGVGAYLEDNTTALAITVNALQNDARGVKQLLWGAANGPGRHNLPHYDWIVDKLAGSNRPILVDNAQRLGGGGRAVLFDLHDRTGCPLVFIGNPQILDQVARSDQEHSRTPKHSHADLKEPRRVALAMIAQYLDEPGQVLDLALAVVEKPYGGHLRALAHLLADMRVLMELPANADDPRGCFLKALASSIDHKDLSA